MPDWSRPEFDWDDANEDHVLRHDVYPEEAEQVYDGRPLIRRFRGRYRVYGRDFSGRYLFVVCEERGDRIRVITAET
jgi:uncharacterized DUF497 family protein